MHVPVGKLRTDRYIPLHPQLVELLDAHRADRVDGIDRLIIWNVGPLDRHQITRMLNRLARHAGIGHVNRGMSLEAVAAMLGHKTLRMTLVYARIADTTVSDAYDHVTDQVDALYTKPAGLRTTGTGTASMAKLAAEYDQRMLGNGYCNCPRNSTANSNRSANPAPTTQPTRPSPRARGSTRPRCRPRPEDQS